MQSEYTREVCLLQKRKTDLKERTAEPASAELPGLERQGGKLGSTAGAG